MPRLIRPLSMLASLGLVLVAVPPALASAPSTDAPAVESPPTTSTPSPRAAGLVVTYEDGSRPIAAVARRADAVAGVETSPAAATPVTENVEALAFDEPTTLAKARAAAADVAALPGVASVEPDVLVTPAAPNDQLWAQQWGIHGTYGSQTHTVWPVTTGRVVVGVVDTGSTSHADLNAGTVAGFDFIANSWTARDGHGRDSNPSDAGDWQAAGQCGPGTRAANSTWHGTHVAGIIGARSNTIGVVGNAPGVRIQHLRALGLCGGAGSDIAAAIVWGSGGSVPGVPRNRTPAKILNLSLSGALNYCPGLVQSAISGARARGTTVVVAAGNDNRDARGYMPANCPGVVTVAATGKAGQRAGGFTATGTWSPYTNYGPAVDLATAGGDAGDSILSTWNTGTSVPSVAGYGRMAGTSMATPAVAAAAALLASHGAYSPATIEAALRWAVKPFPAIANGRPNCTRALCGTGILDVSRLSLARTGPVMSGTARLGATLSTTRGTWTSSPTSYSYRWLRSGRPIAGATGPTYRVSIADGGALIQAQVAGRKGATSPAMWRSTAGQRVPKIASTVRLRVKPKATTYGRKGAKLVATVRVAAGSVSGKVVFRDGKKRIKSVKVKHGKAVLKLKSTKLKRGKHKITAVFVPRYSAYSRATSRPKSLRVR
ncbi:MULTISPECIES: S8 family serine peptidase [Mumia]|nr:MULTISPECIES: S8 family serine peptidase [Mumia]